MSIVSDQSLGESGNVDTPIPYCVIERHWLIIGQKWAYINLETEYTVQGYTDAECTIVC